jgi:hypothetical protein
MPPDPLQPIRDALKAGDKPTAQKLLNPLLKAQPTAETWYLAAQACPTDEKAILCLRKALELEPQHSGANRLLFRLEGAKPAARKDEHKVEVVLPDEPLKKVKRAKKRGAGRTIVLLGLLLFGMSCSLLTMNMVGLIHGPITAVTELTGGATPVTAIDGKPLSEVSSAPLRVSPSQTKPLTARDADVLEPGYAHEYTFSGTLNTEVMVYVQFLSLAANRVSRNVVVLRPDGSNATPTCTQDAILQGDNNVTLDCPIDKTGTWKVRILGRDRESVGAYFVGIQAV